MKAWGTFWVMWFGSVLIGSSAFAGEDPVMKFGGRDKTTGKPCELKIWKTYYEDDKKDWDHLRAEATTSYAHDEHAPAKITLKPKNASVLDGKDGDNVLTVGLLKGSEKDLEKANVFHIKWKHVDHFHNDTCQEISKL